MANKDEDRSFDSVNSFFIYCKMACLNEIYISINTHKVSEEKLAMIFYNFGIEGRKLNQPT